MALNNLKKIVTKRKKRIGRGAGSGKGFHTVGRGQKGQRSRAGNRTIPGFTGGQARLNRALPVFSRMKPRSTKLQAIPLSSFVKNGLLVIGSEEVKKFTHCESILVGPRTYENIDLSKVNIKKGVTISKKLADKILQAGGKVEN
jgi:large subunit ribosomal protein L15